MRCPRPRRSHAIQSCWLPPRRNFSASSESAVVSFSQALRLSGAPSPSSTPPCLSQPHSPPPPELSVSSPSRSPPPAFRVDLSPWPLLEVSISLRAAPLNQVGFGVQPPGSLRKPGPGATPGYRGGSRTAPIIHTWYFSRPPHRGPTPVCPSSAAALDPVIRCSSPPSPRQ